LIKQFIIKNFKNLEYATYFTFKCLVEFLIFFSFWIMVRIKLKIDNLYLFFLFLSLSLSLSLSRFDTL